MSPDLLADGTVKWWSQRRPGAKLTHCMFAAACTPLTFMGYDLPETFVADMRRESGVPQEKPTSTAATRDALEMLIPDCPINYGALSAVDLVDGLVAGEIAARVLLVGEKIPKRLRHWISATFDGGHAIALGGGKLVNGKPHLFWMDPLGRPINGPNQYRGELVTFEEIHEALRKNAQNHIKATWGLKNAALPEGGDGLVQPRGAPLGGGVAPMNADPFVLSRGTAGETAEILRGTPFLHPVNQTFVTRAQKDQRYRLAGRTPDGRFCGVWVNTRRVRGAVGPALLLVAIDQIRDLLISS